MTLLLTHFGFLTQEQTFKTHVANLVALLRLQFFDLQVINFKIKQGQ